MRVSRSLITAALAGFACAQLPDVPGFTDQEDLSTLVSLLNRVPSLVATLISESNLTIFAPVNSAFEGINNATLTNETIEALIAYHVVNGTYTSDNVTDIPTFVPTLLNQTYTINGTQLTNVTGGQNVGLVSEDDNVVVLSGDLTTTNVTEADLQVAGFTIHKIDGILAFPQNVSSTGNAVGLTAAVGALEALNLTDTVDSIEDLTLFLPNNEAFASIANILSNASTETLTSVIQYHAIAGAVVFSNQVSNSSVASLGGNNLNLTVVDDTVFVNGARVVIPNVLVANGVVHVIDSVLNPNSTNTNGTSLDPEASPSAAFSGASSGSNVPFTTNAPSATQSIAIPDIITDAPAASSGGAPPGAGPETTGTEGGDDEGAAPMATANVMLGAGALLVGAMMGL